MKGNPQDIILLLTTIPFVIAIKRLTQRRDSAAPRWLEAGYTSTFMFSLLIATRGMGLSWLGFMSPGLVIGGIGAFTFGEKFKPKSPQSMIAIMTGFGGIAAMLLGGATVIALGSYYSYSKLFPVALAAAAAFGGLTAAGGLIAFARAEGLLLGGNPVRLPGRNLLLASVAAVCVALLIAMMRMPGGDRYTLLVLFGLLFGALLIMGVAVADLPTVLALLGVCGGLAMASTGLALRNPLLIVAGGLVGGASVSLTAASCRATGRSLIDILFGAPSAAAPAKSARIETIAPLFDGARRVVIIPGYGMAVAQAQHAVRDLAALLESRGAEVEFAVHPGAGRMPGHINYLLAEAGISGSLLREPEAINPRMKDADVALVIGASDTVNPLARKNDDGDLSGMTIIDADKARSVVVIKRGSGHGFAGLANPLFTAPNCFTFLGDGKQAVLALTNAIKEI